MHACNFIYKMHQSHSDIANLYIYIYIDIANLPTSIVNFTDKATSQTYHKSQPRHKQMKGD